MGFFDRLKAGLQKTQSKLVHEIKRIITFSPKLSGENIEELEAILLGADLGVAMTQQIMAAVRKSYETQGGQGFDFFAIGRQEIERELGSDITPLKRLPGQTTVISIVGVNGTGKTTTTAKLAHWLKTQNLSSVLGACDTFRAAAIEQLKLWGARIDVPVIAGAYGADPASIAHDAVSAAIAKKADYLLIDTAGRLHTKSNLMKELKKLHRVIGKQSDGAPHETLLILDATTGMNALIQAREFHKAVPLTGLIVTKLDGTSKGGMVIAIQRELGLPIKFIGVGEQPDDLQPFDPKQFAAALFPSD